MRILTLLLLLAGLTVVTASPSSADGETCHGQPATIVGYPGADLVGTTGDDVIVTAGAARVDAREGHDRVCLTGTTVHGFVQVEAGAGDDVVDATADQPQLRRVTARLDAGADTYLGSATEDVVDAQDDNGTPEAVDLVITGAGNDSVKAGRKGVATIDVLSLGDGDDDVDVRGLPGADGQVDGGAGIDTVYVSDEGRAAWTIDNRRQTMAAGTVAMPTTTLEVFRVFLRNSRSIHFRGGAGDETLQIATQGFKDDVVARMGGGDDLVYFWGPFVVGTYDGGRGDDRLTLSGHFVGALASAQGGADLAKGLVWLGDKKPRDHGQASIRSFADVTLDEFGDAVVVGDDRSNSVEVKACRATVHGGSGPDSIVFTAFANRWCGPVSTRHVSAYGQGGNDDLVGSIGRDELNGGGGRDQADGGKGVDTCLAEVRRRC